MMRMLESTMGAQVASREGAKRAEPAPFERLYRDLEVHRSSQAAILGQARLAANSMRSPLSRFLLRLVVENKASQQRILDRLTATLGDALNWTHSSNALPTGNEGEQESAETLKLDEDLLRLESQANKSASQLAKGYAGLAGGIDQVLLRSVAADSDNNSRLLRLVLRTAAAESFGRGEAEDGAATGSASPAERERASLAA